MKSDDAMTSLESFLRRLEAAQIPFHLSRPRLRPPAGSGVRVVAETGDEVWVVEFDQEGSVTADVYRLASKRSPLEGVDALENIFGKSAKAWRAAAEDLGIQFISPFTIRAPDGREVTCAGWLPHFGGKLGTVITSREDPEEAYELADEAGYYQSGLSPRYYDTYDRDQFTGTLRDWGWSGPEELRPDWMKSARLKPTD